MYIRFLAVLFLSSVGLIHTMDPSKTDPFFLIPRDPIKEILIKAHVNYVHPVDFLNLPKVNKNFQNIIADPDFKERCEEAGMKKPEMLFIPKKEKNNKVVQFSYIDPRDKRLAIHPSKKGIFMIDDIKHHAVWVNPKNVDKATGYLPRPKKEHLVTKWPSSYKFKPYVSHKDMHEELAKIYSSDISDDEFSSMDSMYYEKSKSDCTLL